VRRPPGASATNAGKGPACIPVAKRAAASSKWLTRSLDLTKSISLHIDLLPTTPTRDGPRPGVESSYRLCRKIAQDHSKTFYFASLFLAPEKRRAIWAVYAFCRIADDFADSQAPVAERLAAIDGWQAELIAAHEGRPDHPVTVAFADAVRRYKIPIEPALDLLRGARSDVTMRRYATYAELLEYCYHVASTVGLLVCPILGYEMGALQYGIALGRAMQMTNILRDVGEDARAGRIYLPLEDVHRFGYSENRLFAGVIDERFVALMRFEIARVRNMYAEAAPGIELLSPSSRFTVRMAFSLYRRILDEIERNGYDVFTRRAFVPMRAKLRTAMLTGLAAITT
jgi:phytoene synthase